MSVSKTIYSLAAAAAFLTFPICASAQEPALEPAPLQEDILSLEAEAPPEAAVDAPLPEDGAHPLTKADVDAWLDGFLPFALDDGDIVGAQVTVVKDGEILTSRGYGYADLENRTPVDGYKTLFRPGSISKLFTWIAVMQLVEQGEIDLDEDINAYLDFEVPEAFGAPITMRNLMTHTPGFEERFRNLIIGDVDIYLSLEEVLKDAPPPARIFPPGKTPAYSNYGTAVAGYIVQRLSGESFEDYVENHIFEPLGMEAATFRQPLPEQLEENMSKGYRSASHGEAQYYELVPMAPAGSLAADGEAMGRFMIGLLERDPALMKPETWRQMYQTIYQLSPPLNAMALGFWELNKGDLVIRGHGGDTGFFHSDLNVMIDKNVGIYISVNSSGQGAGPLRFAVTADFAKRYFPEASLPVGPRLDTAKEHGEMVVGLYESSRRAATSFAAVTRYMSQEKLSMNEDGDLVYMLFGKPTVWREVEPFVWRHENGYERLTAVRNDDGSLDYVTFEPVSPIFHLLPAPWYRSTAVLNPLLMLAFGALALTLVFWPVRAVVRWRYKQPFSLSGGEAMAHRLVRVAVVLVFAYFAAWITTINGMFSDLAGLGGGVNLMLRLTQAAQVLLYISLGLALWNVVVVWGGKRSWFGKLWSLVLAVAIIIVIWFAAVNGLFSWKTNF